MTVSWHSTRKSGSWLCPLLNWLSNMPTEPPCPCLSSCDHTTKSLVCLPPFLRHDTVTHSIFVPHFLTSSILAPAAVLLFLHRAYFAQAMMEHGDNPLSSPYSQSVVAAYSSACVVLQDTKDQFLKKPFLCARIWRIWSFTFSAAVRMIISLPIKRF